MSYWGEDDQTESETELTDEEQVEVEAGLEPPSQLEENLLEQWPQLTDEQLMHIHPIRLLDKDIEQTKGREHTGRERFLKGYPRVEYGYEKRGNPFKGPAVLQHPINSSTALQYERTSKDFPGGKGSRNTFSDIMGRQRTGLPRTRQVRELEKTPVDRAYDEMKEVARENRLNWAKAAHNNRWIPHLNDEEREALYDRVSKRFLKDSLRYGFKKPPHWSKVLRDVMFQDEPRGTPKIEKVKGTAVSYRPNGFEEEDEVVDAYPYSIENDLFTTHPQLHEELLHPYTIKSRVKSFKQPFKDSEYYMRMEEEEKKAERAKAKKEDLDTYVKGVNAERKMEAAEKKEKPKNEKKPVLRKRKLVVPISNVRPYKKSKKE